jgi:ribosome recycling factor
MQQALLKEVNQQLQSALEYLKGQYSQLQIGRASAGLVESLDVESYGAMQPLKSMANISIPDAQSILIQPWDKSVVSAIEKAIRESDLNLNPNSDGSVIRLNLPPLTEERRKDLVKIVNKMAEEAKITVRQEREKSHKKIKEQEKNKEMTEDDVRLFEKELQKLVDDANKKIDELKDHKDKDIMSV